MIKYKAWSHTLKKPSLIGKTVPEFRAESNHGIFNLNEYEEKWVIFLSHPVDFSPGWASEIERFSRSISKLKALNCELIGIAFENDHSLLMWPRAVQEQFQEKIWFPVIFDPHYEIANFLGMVNQEDMSAGANRSIYIIDDYRVLRSIVYYDPGNSDTMNEIIQLVKLLQRSDACGIVTPESWRPGDEWKLTAPSRDIVDEKESVEMWYF